MYINEDLFIKRTDVIYFFLLTEATAAEPLLIRKITWHVC